MLVPTTESVDPTTAPFPLFCSPGEVPRQYRKLPLTFYHTITLLIFAISYLLPCLPLSQHGIR
jgi:hypothetical protein